MIADETWELWDKILEKARALHPQEEYQFDEYTEYEHNGGKPWGCGGISDEIADIHFSAVMAFLLKPSGDPDEIYTKLMTDWRSLGDGDWSIQPIAVGNVHDRTISRARRRASKTAVKNHSQGEEVGQYAFGARGGRNASYSPASSRRPVLDRCNGFRGRGQCLQQCEERQGS
jgi:hypothetical protein